MRALWLLLWLVLASSCMPTHSLHPDSGPLLTRNGSPFHWAADNFPIAIVIPFDLREDFYFAVEESVEIIHDQVGGEVFYITYSLPDTPHFILLEEAQLDRSDRGALILGLCKSRVKKGFLGLLGEVDFANVYIDTDLDPKFMEFTTIVVLHELLHALGLAHDVLDPGSLMYPETNTDRHIQPEDLEFIRVQARIR